MTTKEYIEFANALKNNYTIDFDKLPEFCDMAIAAVSEKESLKERMEQLYLEESLKEDFENLMEENERLRKALSENKGEWISELELYGEGKWNYQCSVCGRSIRLEQNETLDDYPFCHCGADMRGEKHE